MKKTLETKYKYIEFDDDMVISTYYWFNDYEYNYKSGNDDFNEYKKYIFECYEIAKIFNLKIIEYDDEYIKTSFPRYDNNLLMYFDENICDDNIEKYKTIQPQLLEIIKLLKENNIMHDDLAFRNICYKIENNEIKLYLIDFETLTRDNDFTYFLSYIYNDIKDLIGKSFSDEFIIKTNEILGINEKY